MARVLIVGCGCRGRELAAALGADGHAVRGSTREAGRLPLIEAAGAEAVLADPDRLSTLLPHIAGVSVLCWLMGEAVGQPEAIAALHGARLESLVGKLVDTHVHGLVYEAAGGVDARRLEEGAALVRAKAGRHRIPVEVVETEPGAHAEWLAAMRAAVRRLLEG